MNVPLETCLGRKQTAIESVEMGSIVHANAVPRLHIPIINAVYSEYF
jgi:hypothetical protein